MGTVLPTIQFLTFKTIFNAQTVGPAVGNQAQVLIHNLLNI